MRTFLLALLALFAFAGNSILCRLALKAGNIDAGSFTLLRILSGIAMLFLLLVIQKQMSRRDGNNRDENHSNASSGSWVGGVSLFVYAAFFSYAYITLDTATGALILFGTVQIALIACGVINGDRPSLFECTGFVIACVGFAYLLWPELSKPSAAGLALMIVAGCAWAVYTVLGQGSQNPLLDTAYSFLKTWPLLVLLGLLMFGGVFGVIKLSTEGILLAVMSGALTSGVGYALWYAALRNLTNTAAAVSQLSVPIFAAVFGLIFASEVISQRLVISSAMVLGGILLVILNKSQRKAG